MKHYWSSVVLAFGLIGGVGCSDTPEPAEPAADVIAGSGVQDVVVATPDAGAPVADISPEPTVPDVVVVPDVPDTIEEEDVAELLTIPDPGTMTAPMTWFDDGGYHGTPETAQVMGVVLNVPYYIQGGVDPVTGNHFFVFKTGPEETVFEVSLQDKSSQIDHVHIHDGTGLVFGPEVTPNSVTSPTRADWVLEGDKVYVLEVHSPGGGFF